MTSIEKYVSPFIQSQFPSFYLEDGPNFVAFIEAYYEWLENNYQLLTVDSNTGFTVGDTVKQIGTTAPTSGTIISISGNDLLVKLSDYGAFEPSALFTNDDHLISLANTTANAHVEVATRLSPIYQGRSIFKSRDVDSTLDEFILHFKEKYLKNIDFTTATNKRLLVKNSLDLYRAKGTEKAVDLFFRLIYGTKARVYYPGQDMLKVSDGEWTIPHYIEVTDTIRTVDFVGKIITGAVSRATAFVERYIKRRVSGNVVCVLYVTNMSGTFKTNELLLTDSIYTDSPRIVGSLTSADLLLGGQGFSVGDVVNIGLGDTVGENSLGRVAAIANTTGIVDFTLIDGGWGYTSSAQTIVSEKVLTLNNIKIANTNYFRYFDTLVQPTANVYYGKGNATFTVGETVNYWSNSTTVAASGKVYEVNPSNTTVDSANGYILVSLTTGNSIPAGANLVNSGNTKYANVEVYTDTSARATIMGIPNTALVYVNAVSGVFAKGKSIYQGNSTAVWASAYCSNVTTSGSNTLLQLSNTFGAFRYGSNLTIQGTTTSANVYNIQVTCGVYDIIGSFNTANMYSYSSINGTTGNIIGDSSGIGASFSPGPLGDTETVFLNTDLLNGNNGLITASNAYADFGRKMINLDTVAGFTNSAVIYQEIQTIGFAPTTAVNATSGFIQLLTANTYYSPGDYVKYKALGSNSINEIANSATCWVYQSNSTGLTLAREYDYVVYNTTNFPNFANNLASLGSLHFITKLAHGNAVTVNTSAKTITVTGSQNQWGATPAYGANATQYANSKIFLYNYTVSTDGLQQVTVADPVVSGNALSLSAVPSVNVGVQVNRTLKLGQYAYGFPKSVYGSLNDTIYSMLNYQLFTLGTIGSLTSINPGNTYNVDPYVLVNQPYISNYGRHDYQIVIANAATNFTTGEKITQDPVSLTSYSVTVGNSALFNINDKVYQGTKVAPTATGIVIDIPSTSSVTLGSVTGTLTGNSTVSTNLYSYGSGYVLTTSNSTFFVSGEKIYQGTTDAPTATAIVTGVNTTSITVGSVTGTLVGNSTVAVNTFSYNSQYVLKVANTGMFSIGDFIYQGPNSSATTANAVITNIPNSSILVVGSVAGTITGNSTVTVNVVKFANTAANSAVSNSVSFPASRTTAVALYGTPVTGNSVLTLLITAQGIVKRSATNADNTTTVDVKRINFNNTWQVGQPVTGLYSGVTGNIVSVSEVTSLANNIIGLNAQVSANVVTANGQVTSLDIRDSGFGYVDNHVVQFASSDGERVGSVKVHLGGIGTGSGFYKSSKGFLSDDKYIQDSDYYQEYSYEIISKLPFDKYSEMYTRVMHMSGTKLFGAVEIAEHNQTPAVNVTTIQKNEQISFNSQSDVTSATDSIFVGVKKELRSFDPSLIQSNFLHITGAGTSTNQSPFKVGDQVLYYNTSGAAVTGLANNTYYYVSFANTSGISLTSTLNGSNLSLTPIGSATHYIQKYQSGFSNGDIVTYTVDSTNTAVVASVDIPFSIRTGGITNGGFIKSSTVPLNGTVVSYVPSNYDHAISGITYGFNANTGVRTNGIVRPTNNIFVKGDTVLYYTASGNSALPGLANATTYYVANSVGANVTLSKSNTLTYTAISNTNVLANGQYIIPAANGNPQGLSFKPDGTRMYVIGNQKNSQIQQYALSTPWQVNTATFTTNSYNWWTASGPLTYGPAGLAFKPDGTAVYLSFQNGDKIAQFGLSTPWSVNSASFVQALDTVPTANSITFANSAVDVTTDFITYAGANSVLANSTLVILSTTTVGGTMLNSLANNYPVYIRYANSSGFAISSSLTGANVNIVTAGTGSFKAKQSVQNLTDIKFNTDGTKMYLGRSGGLILEYVLSTAWDISTATLNYAKSTSPGLSASPQGITFTADGKKLFALSTSTNSIFSYSLATPWDLSSATYDSQRKAITPNTSANSYALEMKPDASRFFTGDITSNSVTEYDWYTTYPSQNVESGHYLLKTEFTTTNANTSGFKLKANNNVVLSFKSTTLYTETHKVSINSLQSGISYYVVNSTPMQVQLALTSNGTAINITANSTASGQATSGHYLEKVVEG